MMRPDSIDPLPEPIKTEPMSRVNPTRQKEREDREREERDREAGDRKRRKPRHGRDGEAGSAADAERPVEGPTAPAGGKSPRRGKHLDLTI